MKKFKSIIAIIVLAIFLVACLNLQAVLAITSSDLLRTSGSLTIVKYETGKPGHEGEMVGLNGVEFKLYKVNDDETSTVEPTTAPTATATTANGQVGANSTDGVASFPDLALGRYLVVEGNGPESVTESISNFLVDIPTTSTQATAIGNQKGDTQNNDAEGTNLVYDVIVYPKNNTVYGKINILKNGTTKVDGTEQVTQLNGVRFLLQKYNGTSWENYHRRGSTADIELLTANGGEANLTNIPAGTYRFVETDIGPANSGYILDNKTGYEFSVRLGSGAGEDPDKTYVVVPGDSGDSVGELENTITINNEKPTISKTITNVFRSSSNPNKNTAKDNPNNDNTTDTAHEYSGDIGDTVTFRVVADVPKSVADLATYQIKETLSAGLTKSIPSVIITGLTSGTDYTIEDPETSFTVTFTEAGKRKLANMDSIVMTYNATINSEADATGTGNTSTSELKYSNIVATNYNGDANPEASTSTSTATATATAKVYTGGFYIHKVNASNQPITGSSAIFKISNSQNDATFLKDTNGNEITLTTDPTTGAVSYKGLTYGTYYLVEVQAPIDTTDGKSYNLLNKSVEFTVGATTYDDANAYDVVNKKGTILPTTGGIGAVLLVVLGITLVATGVIVNKKSEEK